MNHSFGYIPSIPDARDEKYHFKTLKFAKAIPPSCDLSKTNSSVRDQGQLGSCTWETAVGFLEYAQMHNKKRYATLSVLFGYWNTRNDEGNPNEDTGCEPRDVMKTMQKLGTCMNKYWPYLISKFSRKPSLNAYLHSVYKITNYHRLETLQDIKMCIAGGWPVMLGFMVYESFGSDIVAKTGIMPMPKPGETILGGHMVLASGYDDTKKQLKIKNSWGSGWGDRGYFYMPYDFVTPNDVSDLWTATP